MNSFPPLFPTMNDENKNATMLRGDFQSFLALANNIQNETAGPDSIKLCCDIIHFLQHCSEDGKWCDELDFLLLRATRCLLTFMSENSTACQTIYRQDVSKPISSLCSYFFTTRCRLRRSLSPGSLPKKCLVLLSATLELLLVRGRPSSSLEVLDILDAFVSCPASIVTPTSMQFWDMFDPKVLPWLVDHIFG